MTSQNDFNDRLNMTNLRASDFIPVYGYFGFATRTSRPFDYNFTKLPEEEQEIISNSHDKKLWGMLAYHVPFGVTTMFGLIIGISKLESLIL